MIYADVRRTLAGDLRDMRLALLQIDRLLALRMSGTITSIMAEFAANFPRELDFRVEREHTERARRLLALSLIHI